MGFKSGAPELGGALVVAAQVLHVESFETPFLQGAQHGADVRQLAAREHIAVDEMPPAQARLAVEGVGAGDAVVHHPAIGLEQAADVAEVAHQVLQPHVLEHAHAGDAVKRRVLHVAVVLQADVDAVLQPGRAHALARQVKLVLRQRHAHALRAKPLRRTQHQCAPATANVEQALARLQADLAQDVVDLFHLRFVQRLVAVFEIGARIHHALTEPLGVERVGHVVVVLDRLAVARARVGEVAANAPQHTRFGLGRLGQPVRHGEDVGHRAVHVHQALHIGLAQRVQPRVNQQRQRRRIAHADFHHRLLEVAQRQRRTATRAPTQAHRQVHLGLHPLRPRQQRAFDDRSHARSSMQIRPGFGFYIKLLLL